MYAKAKFTRLLHKSVWGEFISIMCIYELDVCQGQTYYTKTYSIQYFTVQCINHNL